MIVALVAVVGAVLPPILNSIKQKDSILIVSEVSSTRISVANLGDAPGIINSIQMHWGINDMPLIAGSGGGGPANELDDPVIRPGETRWFELSLPAPSANFIDFSKITDPFNMPCVVIVSTTSAQQDRQYARFSQQTCGVLLNALPGISLSSGQSPTSAVTTSQ